MMGRQKLRETKTQVRQAFAKRGLDVERWLDQQMAMLNRQTPPAPEAMNSLRLLRDALANRTRAKKKGKRSAP